MRWNVDSTRSDDGDRIYSDLHSVYFFQEPFNRELLFFWIAHLIYDCSKKVIFTESTHLASVSLPAEMVFLLYYAEFLL